MFFRNFTTCENYNSNFLTMSRLQVFERFSCLEKILLIALLVVAGANISQVLAINSEDNQVLFVPAEEQPVWLRHKYFLTEKQYRGDHAAVFSSIGRRRKMEDTFALEENIGDLPVSLYGVFDGHGGDKSSKDAAQHLINILKEKLRIIHKYTKGSDIDYISFLTNEIQEYDNKLLVELENEKDGSGTTAVIALMVNRMLYIANVGDSRLVIDDDDAPNDEKATQITKDHKPLAEKARIEDEGSVIWQYPEQEVYRVGERIFHEDGTTSYNGLATSRALGDWYLKGINCGLISTPEIFTVDLSLSKTNFVILATDGLWDVVTNAEAARVIRHNFNDGLFGAERLVDAAGENPNFSDNITVMVIDTRPYRYDQDDQGCGEHTKLTSNSSPPI